MACETDVRLFKSIKVQSFKMVKPCPQTPSLQDHALEPGHWQDWRDWLLPLLLGPVSNMLCCFYLYLQVSGTVHSPHGFCPKHYCIFFLLYHSIGSSNIYIRSQGFVNILKCSAFLLLIMCAAGSARAGASQHPLSVRALTWLNNFLFGESKQFLYLGWIITFTFFTFESWRFGNYCYFQYVHLFCVTYTFFWMKF